MTYILGINSAYHESSSCLVKDGKIVAVAEEERFNRIKHAKQARVDNPDELPQNSIDYCLSQAGISLGEVDHIGYSLNPQVRFAKNTQHEYPYPVTQDDFGTAKGEEEFHRKTTSVADKIKEKGFTGKFHYLSHHDCHAASSYFVSPYNEAGVLVVDGIGEFESTTLYKGTENKLEKIASIDFPNSLGFLWEKLSKFLGFSGYDACKVMGLASYGDPSTYRDQFESFVSVNQDGTFTVDDRITQFRNEEYSRLEELFDLEKQDSPIKNVNKKTHQYADLAASLQELTEDIVLKLGKSLKDQTGLDHLCLSGGVGLNCVANGRLVRERIFDDVFVQPSAHDAGTALGAAYLIWNQQLDQPRSYEFDNSYLGPSFSNEEIRRTLDENGLKYEQSEGVEKATAKLIADGKVIGWFQGAMEFGPRALGNRSILADPRRKDAVALLNYKVKHREPFRPFCPSVLEEKASEWFDVQEPIPSPAKYMLGAFDVLDYQRDIIPAVTHIDGTSRIQVVSENTNQKFHKLIEEFEKVTGVPIVLNTSFNDREPIVCTPQDAVNTFLKTRIDYLAIGDFLVSRRDNNGK